MTNNNQVSTGIFAQERDKVGGAEVGGIKAV